jgi:MFS family permease
MNRTSATWVRWRIVALLVALSFLSWFLRVSMPVAYDEQIRDQFSDLSTVAASAVGMAASPAGQGPLAAASGLLPTRTHYAISEKAIGFVYSAFLLVYMLCMTPGGGFIDRFGARRALVVMGFGLAAFTALTGLVGLAAPRPGTLVLSSVGSGMTAGILALALFLLIRSLMGGFAAPMYPASAHAVARWMPFRQRTLANGLIQGAACVGIASTPLVFGGLIDWFGWSTAFLVIAAGTAVVAFLWAACATDRPEQHPRASPAERQLIREADPEPPALGKPAGSWLWLLRNRSLLLLTTSYAAVGYFEYLFFFWIDYYFKKELGFSDEVRRLCASIPFLTMAVGMALGGWLTDWTVRWHGYRRGRAVVTVVAMMGASAFLCAGLLVTGQAALVVATFSLALGMLGAVEAPTWTTAQELGGRRGGMAAGFCNTGGNIGGLLAPVVTPWVAEHYGWTWAIGLAAVVCLLGVCLWGWIDPRERVDEKGNRFIQR